MIKIDQLIRTRRKTFGLIVTREGKLVIRAPLRASRAEVEAVVAARADWIRAHQSEMLTRPRLPVRQFASGETFPYLGQSYPLAYNGAANHRLELRDGRFYLAASSQANVRKAFLAWYRGQARALLTERVRLHATRLGLRPSTIRISSARTRWGSCSGKGTLSFTWRLVLAPLEVVDYVVVHELVHLAVHNHSRAFWQRVAAAYPGYLDARRWLKEHSGLGEELGLDQSA